MGLGPRMWSLVRVSGKQREKKQQESQNFVIWKNANQ